MADKNIFIIEDDINILYGLQAKFRVGGFNVKLSSGEEGIQELVDNINFFNTDYLIMDVILPNLDGFEVIKKVRENIGNSLPVFVFSDVSEQDIKTRGKDYGSNFYFLKQEVDIDEFTQRVLKIIENKEKSIS